MSLLFDYKVESTQGKRASLRAKVDKFLLPPEVGWNVYQLQNFKRKHRIMYQNRGFWILGFVLWLQAQPQIQFFCLPIGQSDFAEKFERSIEMGFFWVTDSEKLNIRFLPWTKFGLPNDWPGLRFLKFDQISDPTPNSGPRIQICPRQTGKIDLIHKIEAYGTGVFGGVKLENLFRCLIQTQFKLQTSKFDLLNNQHWPD